MKKHSKPDQTGGHVPPLRGVAMPSAPHRAVTAAGAAPKQNTKEITPMTGIRAGTPPTGQEGKAGYASETPRSSAAPKQGKIIKGTPMTVGVAATGGAPRGNMSTSAGKAMSDVEQNKMDVGRRYAKGGQVGGDKWIQGAVKHPGVEKAAAKADGESTHAYMEQHKDSPGKAGSRARLGLRFEGGLKSGGAVTGGMAQENGYASGGKVNRHGSDKGRVVKPLGNEANTSAPANGGNGGLLGGNAPIPLSQPGGVPSTGVTSSGRMVPSFAGQDTAGNGLDGKPANNLRTAPVARRGKLPSFSRPRRAA